MTIAFHTDQLSLRGTEVALFDYAYNNQHILGNESIIITKKQRGLDTYPKFNEHFEIILYENFQELPLLLKNKKIDVFYFIKHGLNDGLIFPDTKNVVHAVFQQNEPHGDVYAYVSEWLSKKMSNGNIPYVPHMVDIKRYDHDKNYKKYLNIPKDAYVFGYYGGNDSFNIDFVKRAVIDVAKKNKKIFFIFMNVDSFYEGLDNIIFFTGTHDMIKKIAFINTCDACLHARYIGESFGLTIAEFSTKNKPILTKAIDQNYQHDAAHIDMLGKNAILYNSYDQLCNILENFKDMFDLNKDWNSYKEYTPEKVMEKFNKVFLK